MASKSKERKKNRVTKAAGKPAEAEDDRAAARRAALMKNKLTAAMEDPLMRSQIVAAIRAMMKEPR